MDGVRVIVHEENYMVVYIYCSGHCGGCLELHFNPQVKS